jgi:flagellar basal body-associated protein FliL
LDSYTTGGFSRRASSIVVVIIIIIIIIIAAVLVAVAVVMIVCEYRTWGENAGRGLTINLTTELRKKHSPPWVRFR